MPNLYMF